MMSIGRVVGMAPFVPGNVSAGAEANMASDPEAADAVLRSGRKLTMVGLDVTHRVVLTRRDIAGWTARHHGGCAFASMVEHYIVGRMNAPYLGGCALHDPLAVAGRSTPRS
ncbi:MAG: nucleoside hydrolase [Collinsella sp.]